MASGEETVINSHTVTEPNDEDSGETTVSVVKFGKSYRYQIPSFPVMTVDLRHVSIQTTDDDGALMLADVFFREDSSCKHHFLRKLLMLALLM